MEGEAEYQPIVDRYIEHLHEKNLLGSYFYDQRLENFHAPVDLAAKNLYYAKPRKIECFDQVDETPNDHPPRVIAAVLESASNNSIVRFTACVLLDGYVVD